MLLLLIGDLCGTLRCVLCVVGLVLVLVFASVLGVGAVRVFVVGGICGDCVCGVGALRVACGGVLVDFSWVC